MGRIVRRFASFFEQEMRGNLKIGEWTAAAVLGIAQYEAGQRLHEVVLQSNALGGASRAGYFANQVTVSVTAVPAALHARMQVPTGVVITGSTYGIHIEQEVTGTGQITLGMEGIRMELYAPNTTDLNIVYGIFMSNTIQSAPTAYTFIRLDENGGQTVNTAIDIGIGGAGDILNVLTLRGAETAWNATTNPPGGGSGVGSNRGRFAVLVGNEQRWVQLYT